MAPRKTITIKRKGYTRKDGTRVRATTFKIKDPGKPGKTSRGAKAGPHRDELPWIGVEGGLGGPGFLSRPDAKRHTILREKVSKDGYRTVLGRLAVLERSSTISLAKRAKAKKDREFLVRNFGGRGSFVKPR